MGFEYINAGKLDEYIGVPGVVIIDLREPRQYAWSHFAGAINVPYHRMETLLDNGGYGRGSANGVYDKASANGGYDKGTANGGYGKNYGRAFDRELDRGFDRSGKLIISGNAYDRSNYFIFYCERGSLSMIISSRMASMGYNAGTVVGGIRQYRGRNMIR